MMPPYFAVATLLMAAATVRELPPPPPPTAPAPKLATAAAILEEVHRPGARAVLLNVWATWCTPCRQEFPDILKVAREFAPQGLRLVLVSADFHGMEPEVRQFLSSEGVDFTTYFREGKDEGFINAMSPRWSGAIPATFVYDRSGKLVRLWEGKASYAVIKSRVQDALAAKESP
jgi:thiol-disulfide isomerase/thioredoxin